MESEQGRIYLLQPAQAQSGLRRALSVGDGQPAIASNSRPIVLSRPALISTPILLTPQTQRQQLAGNRHFTPYPANRVQRSSSTNSPSIILMPNVIPTSPIVTASHIQSNPRVVRPREIKLINQSSSSGGGTAPIPFTRRIGVSCRRSNTRTRLTASSDGSSRNNGISSSSFYNGNATLENDIQKYIKKITNTVASNSLKPKKRCSGGKPKETESVCITISSDSEDETSSKGASSNAASKQPANVSNHASAELPAKRAKQDDDAASEMNTQESRSVCLSVRVSVTPGTSSPPPSPISDESLSRTTLNMRVDSIRVGQLKLIPGSVLRISHSNLRMTANCPTLKFDVILTVPWQGVVNCDLCHDPCEPCMYLVLDPSYLPKLREDLKMEKGKHPYYDPGGEDDERFFIFYINPAIYSSAQCNFSTLTRKIDLIRRKLRKPLSFCRKISFEESESRQTEAAAAGEPEPSQTPHTPSGEQAPLTPATPSKGHHVITRNQAKATTASDDLKFVFTGPRVKLFVYPPPPATGGITMTNEDQFCLNKGEFLNDVIIDFYLKYISDQILSPKDRARSHFFSCFFYERLMQKGVKKNKEISAAERRHDQVKKWTRSVDLFSKELIFIPINEASHWFLAVICFPSLAGDNALRNVQKCSGQAEKYVGLKVIKPAVPTSLAYLSQYGEENDADDESSEVKRQEHKSMQGQPMNSVDVTSVEVMTPDGESTKDQGGACLEGQGSKGHEGQRSSHDKSEVQMIGAELSDVITIDNSTESIEMELGDTEVETTGTKNEAETKKEENERTEIMEVDENPELMENEISRIKSDSERSPNTSNKAEAFPLSPRHVSPQSILCLSSTQEISDTETEPVEIEKEAEKSDSSANHKAKDSLLSPECISIGTQELSDIQEATQVVEVQKETKKTNSNGNLKTNHKAKDSILSSKCISKCAQELGNAQQATHDVELEKEAKKSDSNVSSKANYKAEGSLLFPKCVSKNTQELSDTQETECTSSSTQESSITQQTTQQVVDIKTIVEKEDSPHSPSKSSKAEDILNPSEHDSTSKSNGARKTKAFNLKNETTDSNATSSSKDQNVSRGKLKKSQNKILSKTSSPKKNKTSSQSKKIEIYVTPGSPKFTLPKELREKCTISPNKMARVVLPRAILGPYQKLHDTGVTAHDTGVTTYNMSGSVCGINVNSDADATKSKSAPGFSCDSNTDDTRSGKANDCSSEEGNKFSDIASTDGVFDLFGDTVTNGSGTSTAESVTDAMVLRNSTMTSCASISSDDCHSPSSVIVLSSTDCSEFEESYILGKQKSFEMNNSVIFDKNLKNSKVKKSPKKSPKSSPPAQSEKTQESPRKLSEDEDRKDSEASFHLFIETSTHELSTSNLLTPDMVQSIESEDKLEKDKCSSEEEKGLILTSVTSSTDNSAACTLTSNQHPSSLIISSSLADSGTEDDGIPPSNVASDPAESADVAGCLASKPADSAASLETSSSDSLDSVVFVESEVDKPADLPAHSQGSNFSKPASAASLQDSSFRKPADSAASLQASNCSKFTVNTVPEQTGEDVSDGSLPFAKVSAEKVEKQENEQKREKKDEKIILNTSESASPSTHDSSLKTSTVKRDLQTKVTKTDGDVSDTQSPTNLGKSHESPPMPKLQKLGTISGSSAINSSTTDVKGCSSCHKSQKEEPQVYKRPCILIFDSLRGPSRSKIATHLREYLTMEWKTRKKATHGEKVFDKDTLKMCSPAIPQQDNYTDCGVFLLHYVEKFFSEPITNFSLPIRDLMNWFNPAECSSKRDHIKKVIDELHEDWVATSSQ